MADIKDPEVNTGYIKLHRRILNWEWYDDIITKSVFLHCLLKANHTEKKWRGITIPRGSFITSYAKLAEELKLSKKQIRTAIEKLKTTGELAHKTTNKYSIITVINYSLYQSEGIQDDIQEGTQRALKGQAEGTQRATTNNDKNDNNDKNINLYIYTPADEEKEPEKEQKKKPTKHKYGEYQNVLLTDDEYSKLKNQFPNTDEAIEFLSVYIAEKGYKSKSHYLALRRWVFNALKEQKKLGAYTIKPKRVVEVPEWMKEQDQKDNKEGLKEKINPEELQELLKSFN